MKVPAAKIKCPHCGAEIEEWQTVTAVIPADARSILDEAVTEMESELRDEGIALPTSRRLAMGQVLEMLAASYVAGQRTTREALAAMKDSGAKSGI